MSHLKNVTSLILLTKTKKKQLEATLYETATAMTFQYKTVHRTLSNLFPFVNNKGEIRRAPVVSNDN